jgi:hypothetical protein
MKIKKTILVMSFGFATGISLIFSCDKKSEDPCKALHGTSADFTVEELVDLGVGEKWSPYDTDTVCTRKVKFSAKDSLADSYEWHIGNGVYTNRSQTIIFPDILLNQALSIQLIVKKRVNQNCFPKDNGLDTVIRKILFVDNCKSKINGSYVGYNEGQMGDTFNITLLTCQQDPHDSSFIGTYIFNLYKDCGKYISSTVGFKEINFGENTSSCQAISGNAVLADKNTIIVNYSYFIPPNFEKTVSYKFIGKRIK